MSNKIVLSKIAKLAVDEQTLSCDRDDITYLHKDKKWILLDEFRDDARNIFRIISRLELNFAFTSIDDQQHLVICYTNPFRIIQRRKYVIEDLFALLYPSYKRTLPPSDIEDKVLNTYLTTNLFEALQIRHNENIGELENNMQHRLTLPDKFLPTLCEYQRKSVLWLLKREIHQESYLDYYQKLVAKDKTTVVYKHLFSLLMQTMPPEEIKLPPGGILADEMGLGKTVEMLALILLNPCTKVTMTPQMKEFIKNIKSKRRRTEINLFCICKSDSLNEIVQCEKCNLWQHKICVTFDDSDPTSYMCPSCWHHAIEEYGLLNTKASFIVSPNIIKMQWVSEIKRHIQPTLRIFLYEGASSEKWISPLQLSDYDIVLTDYNILRRDFYFTQNNVSERIMRNKPRSMRVNTPILMLKWWRVLLDEAQMVESNTSLVASLVRMIPATNRWAVTGTPIQKSLNDLQPLLQFIGFEAVSNRSTWQQIVNIFAQQHGQNEDLKCSHLINILQKCMWRTCKAQVASELEIPPQKEVLHRIQFDNLEKLFYKEQHAECHKKFLENVHKYTQRMSTISPQVMNTILQPFLKIRQTCTIPVVVATSSANSNNNFNTHQQKQFLQPQELHDYLKSTNEISCKMELRTMASSHNGLAALYFLQKKFDQAIKNYEAVLKLAIDYNDMNIVVDSLLQIHALHNILQIKELRKSTENLESYKKQYNELEGKYLSTYASNLATVKSAYEAAKEKFDSDIAQNFMTIMAEALTTLTHNDEFCLIQKIQEECSLSFGKSIIKLSQIKSSGTLFFVVSLWYNKVENVLKTLQHEIENLSYFCENVRSCNQVSPDIWRDIMRLVNSVYDCHLSGIRDIKKSKQQKQKKGPEETKKLCKMCHIRNSINEFECLLFDKVIDEGTNYTEGLENPSFEMYLCKLTFQFVRNKNRLLHTAMGKNWSHLENLQLICKRLIKLWIEMEYTIKAYDELDMCKMRTALTQDADDKSIFKIMRHEIEGRIIEQLNELMSAQHQFTTKMARLRYIKHLEGNDDPGPCPICRLAEDDRYVVLECGHHICFPCLKSLRIHAKGNQFKCSICRNMQQNQTIYYVSREKNNSSESETIKGHYSSKITYIVRLILQLQKQHNEKYQSSKDTLEMSTVEDTLKILIFSQWEPIIHAIALALKENDIKFRAQWTPKIIEEFKNPKLGITCLLMPFVRGSKGLNLVEATHVFLVEPILNPGEELQAVGRVHRFGQKRQTTVHRFIVSQTIEENIYNFIISSASNTNNASGIQRKWEFDNISLRDFENLFSLQQTGEYD